MRVWLAGCVVLGLALWAPETRACGGFFTETNSSDVATLSDVRVLLVRWSDRLDQYVQVGYAGGATRFAWIYPVPSNPQVSEAKSSPFEKLEELTRPRITIVTPHGSSGGGGGFGCGAADGAATRGGEGQDYDPKVKVWQTGQVGSFDYVVLTATNVGDLLGWLQTNGFAVPTSTNDVLAYYLAQKWYFVAMKLSIQSSSAEVPSTTVLRLSYAATSVRYPLRMVSLSPAAETSFEFYLVSTDGKSELAPEKPFTALTLDSSQLKALSSTEHNYKEAFDATLKQAGTRGLVREYSSTDWEGASVNLENIPGSAVLTRLRAKFGPEAMTQDLVFVSAPYTYVSPSHTLQYTAGQAASVPLGLLLLVGGWRLRRALRRRARSSSDHLVG